MKIVKYFFEFICIISLFSIFKIIGLRNASNIGSILGKFVGPLFRSKDIIKKLNYFRQPFNINTFAQLLAAECLKDKKYISDSLKHNLNGINFLEEELNKLGLDYLSSYGNFITFKLGARTSTIFKKLLSLLKYIIL